MPDVHAFPSTWTWTNHAFLSQPHVRIAATSDPTLKENEFELPQDDSQPCLLCLLGALAMQLYCKFSTASPRSESCICWQGHEAILQKFYEVNLVLVDSQDPATLLEVHIVGPRTQIVAWASKAFQAAMKCWETQ